MPNILTSWKEISLYLGKGIRTAQRWEREAGLPVRRQAEPNHRAVLAIPDELDTWIRTRLKGPGASLVDALIRDVAALQGETAELRHRLEVLESVARDPDRALAMPTLKTIWPAET